MTSTGQEVMSDARWRQLMNDDSLSLTPQEIAQGWHFCWEMDGLLRQPQDDPDGWVCACLTHTGESLDGSKPVREGGE